MIAMIIKIVEKSISAIYFLTEVLIDTRIKHTTETC